MPSRIPASTLADLAKDSPVITCSFDYLEKSARYDSEKPYYFSGPLDSDQEPARTNLAYTTHDNIQVRDLRGKEQKLKLEAHGFQLIAHTPKTDLTDPDEREVQNYLEEISSFIKDELNAELVLAYSYRVSVLLLENNQ
jgi:hypothetical protein